VPRPLRSFRRGLAALAGTALVAALPVVSPRPQEAVASARSAATTASASPAGGYWLVGGDGSVYPFGAAGDLGSLRGTALAHPVAGMTPTPSGAGYWLVGSDGGIFAFGDAGFYGSTGALKLNQPIVGMAATPTGKGYWFVASDGGIFSFGDAAFSGSTGALKLNRPIVGMAPTPTGNGYWFVASDGGVFSFGDAAFYGSTGATPLNRPIVGMAASPSGKGYWFVASDGGIFNFGDAAFLGSAGGRSLPSGVVVMSGAGQVGPSSTPGTTGTTPTTSGPGTSPTTNPTSPTTTTATTDPPARHSFQIGLVGDTGYTPADAVRFDKVLAQMNRFPLAFVAHDGDFKNPTTACTNDTFEAVKASFNTSKAPFVYAVGDNEWMDCNNTAVNPNVAPMDSVERLHELRELFFADDQSLGVNRMPLTTQRQAGYPENARWSKGGVVFATLNTPGPSDDIMNTDESGPRRVANLAWLQTAFDQAQSSDAAAVMIIWQADPWFSTPGHDFSATWKYLIDALKERTAAFGKPVVLVHGDTHVFRIDNPFDDPNTAKVEYPNFTRVETHALAGDAINWIRATVDPSDPKVFSFTTERAG
jgi:ribosomal protein L24E